MSYESFLAHEASVASDDSGFERFVDNWDADYDLHNKSEDFVGIWMKVLSSTPLRN